jgi:hypothetical protein
VCNVEEHVAGAQVGSADLEVEEVGNASNPRWPDGLARAFLALRVAVHGGMKMKRVIVAGSLLVMFATGVAAGEVHVGVDYDAAGLTQIKIENGRLHYVWHTPRHYGEGKRVVAQQDMTAYDRHEAHIWLTEEETEAVAEWIEEHNVLDMQEEYPTRQPGSYGSAFEMTLEASREDRMHSIRWTADSKITEELRTAVAELEELCKTIRRSRLGEGG